jgi:hypothetical protein
MSRPQVRLSARRDKLRFRVAIAATAVATLHAWTGAYAAGEVVPMVLTDTSCQNVTGEDAAPRTDCTPDASTWTQQDPNVQQVVVARNIDAPGSRVVVSHTQDAPISQVP